MALSPSIQKLKEFLSELRLNISVYEFKRLFHGYGADEYGDLWKDNYNDPILAEKIMMVINKLIEGHGIETIECNWVSHYWRYTNFLYVNMGDIYNNTIIYNDIIKDRFKIATSGDYLEK